MAHRYYTSQNPNLYSRTPSNPEARFLEHEKKANINVRQDHGCPVKEAYKRKLRKNQATIEDQRLSLAIVELEKQSLEYNVLDLEAEVRSQNQQIAKLQSELEQLNHAKKSYLSYNIPSLPFGGNDAHGVDQAKILSGFFCLCGMEFGTKSSFQNHITKATKKKFEFDLEAVCGRRHKSGVDFFQMCISEKGTEDSDDELSSSVIGCKSCKIVFSSQMDFRRHQKTVHFNKEDSMITSPQPVKSAISAAYNRDGLRSKLPSLTSKISAAIKKLFKRQKYKF